MIGGLVFQPWKLLASYGTYIFGWLDGYSSFLGSIAGVLIADYYIVRKKIILTEDLYHRGGYEFSRGVNWRAIGGLAASIFVALIGLGVEPFAGPGQQPRCGSSRAFLGGMYHYARFVGFLVWFLVYLALMSRPSKGLVSWDCAHRHSQCARKSEISRRAQRSTVSLSLPVNVFCRLAW